MREFEDLKRNIEDYSRRSYLSRLVSGALIALAVILALYLFFVSVEYFFRLSSLSRGVLFYGFAVVCTGVVVIQLVIPFLRMVGALPKRAEDLLAKEIGTRIPQVEDKLINALNLHQQMARRGGSSLLAAGLSRASLELNRFDFASTIDLKTSLRWAKYTLIPVLVTFIISVVHPNLLSEGTNRILHYNEAFTPPAPFRFIMEQEEYLVPEGEDLVVNVLVDGDALPSNCFILTDAGERRMKRLGPDKFSYTIGQVRSDMRIRFRGASVFSEEVLVRALAKPNLMTSQAEVRYPSYTGLNNSSFENRLNLELPEGSRLKWAFNFKNGARAAIVVDTSLEWHDGEQGVVYWEDRVTRDKKVDVVVESNEGLLDSISVEINVIRDGYPVIQVKELKDTITGIHYFSGEVGDDYGFSGLRFVVMEAEQEVFSQPVGLVKGLLEQRFSYAWNPDSLLNQEARALSYYFIVSDNDGVNGAKSTQSHQFSVKALDAQELSELSSQEADRTKDRMQNELDELKGMNDELNDIKKDLLQKKKPDWEDQERLKDLLQKQQEMMEKLQQRAKEQRRFFEKSEQIQDFSQELLEKQQRIQEMFEKLFDEEFKEKYREYQELLNELNKEQMLEKVDEMKMDNEALEKELDRTLELFKELEFEQKLEESLERIDQLQEQQEQLNQATESKSEEPQSLAQEQERLSEELEELNKELQEMEALNEALEDPKPTPDIEQEQQDASSGMQGAQEQLEKGNEKKAGPSQKQASEALQKMGEKLRQFQQDQMATQQAEDLGDMRQLLENIVDLSLAQERILGQVKRVMPNDPKYVELAKDQKKIMDDTRVVEDSLLSLSKRVPQIDRVVNDEITSVKYSMEKGLDYLTNQPPNQERRYVNMAAERQQYAMTSLNNLALLFDEIIQQKQQQMGPSMKGSGDCKKPGSGQGQKPSASDLKKMQESLNNQLQQLKEAKEKGKNPNGKKPGERGGQGMGGMSKEMARLAAEQSAIREQLRKMSESMGGEGGKPGSEMREMERLMEQTEEDILFDQISAETMKRQEEILTKLLESERAEREQEMDKEREAKSSYTNFQIPDKVWEEFEREKEKEVEFYQTVPPNLKPFYRNEVNRYFSTIPLTE